MSQLKIMKPFVNWGSEIFFRSLNQNWIVNWFKIRLNNQTILSVITFSRFYQYGKSYEFCRCELAWSNYNENPLKLKTMVFFSCASVVHTRSSGIQKWLIFELKNKLKLNKLRINIGIYFYGFDYQKCRKMTCINLSYL